MNVIVMLRQTACVAKRINSRREAQQVAQSLRKALEQAASSEIKITGTTYQSLTYAFSRAGDIE
eukprot:scaffold67438_cov48-Prasinocladus_malaysianus.AAC.1